MGEDDLLRAETGAKDDVEVCFVDQFLDSKLIRGFFRYILDNQEVIARIACLDSGKTKIDASLGEILVTVEKLKWTIEHGEKALKAQQRPTNFLMMYKKNRVIWEPLGVVAACVSWK